MFIFLVSILVLSLTCNYAEAYYEGQPRCPLGWTRNRNTCYLLVKELSTWWQAVGKCSALDSYLMYVETEGEADYVAAVAAKNGRNIWVGGTDEFKDGNYIWHATGKPMTVTRWDIGQPQAHNTEHYVVVAHGDGKWHDVIDTAKYFYMCKKQIEICSCRPIA